VVALNVSDVQAKALTTSVDHSPICLDVAMANFRLNGIPLPLASNSAKSTASRGTLLTLARPRRRVITCRA
jgi:hypothetical protein